MYTKPKALLTTQSLKTIKGEKRGITTYIMYLAPHKQNAKGKNLCPHATNGCAKACLYNSGNARFNKVQKSRINKSNYFIYARDLFLKQLYIEIAQAEILHKIENTPFAVRLNGTSDIMFEKYKIIDDKNIFELFPNVQFYDYTKIPNRLNNIPSNYHLTFSRSENNDHLIKKVLNKGVNVAVVFDKLPKKYLGVDVLNGDIDDLRFLDKKGGYVIGLTYKKATVKGSPEINKASLKSDFIIKTN